MRGHTVVRGHAVAWGHTVVRVPSCEGTPSCHAPSCGAAVANIEVGRALRLAAAGDSHLSDPARRQWVQVATFLVAWRHNRELVYLHPDLVERHLPHLAEVRRLPMGVDADPVPEDLPAPGPSTVSPDRRPELSLAADPGRGSHRHRYVGGIGPTGNGHRPPAAGGAHQMVQPVVAAAYSSAAPHRRDRCRQRAAGRSRNPTVHSPLPGHRVLGQGQGSDRLPVLAAMAALLQPVLHAVHDPLWGADPLRPSSAVLDPPLHSRAGLVQDPKARARRSAVDRQAGLHQPPGSGRPPRATPLHRSGPLVAPQYRHVVADQRHRLLHLVVPDPSMGTSGTHQLGACSPTRCR